MSGVVLVRVGGQGAQADGHAGGLEVGRVEGDDADGVVVVGLQVLDGDRGLLRGDIPDIDAIDANDILDHRGALGRLPVQQHAVGLDAGQRNEGRNGDFEAKHLDQLFDGLREDLVGAESDPAAVSITSNAQCIAPHTRTALARLRRRW